MHSLIDINSMAVVFPVPSEEEILKLTVGDTSVWLTSTISDIPAEGTSRILRRGEKEAVERLVAHAFGDDAILCHTAEGAPYVDGCRCGISITHGAGFAALCVADEPVGIDVESPRAQLRRVARRFLNAVDPVDSESPVSHLQWAWTVKEAVYKAALTPGLPLTDIQILSWREAQAVTKGEIRRYRLNSVRINDAILTVAKPKR